MLISEHYAYMSTLRKQSISKNMQSHNFSFLKNFVNFKKFLQMCVKLNLIIERPTLYKTEILDDNCSLTTPNLNIRI